MDPLIDPTAPVREIDLADVDLRSVNAWLHGKTVDGLAPLADVVIDGNAGTGVGENMMSGSITVTGNASQSAGATAHGGLLIIEGDASARCGISMKGVDMVLGGSIGHMSAFMAQAGRLVVRGDAGEALGDSIYEARLYVRASAIRASRSRNSNSRPRSLVTSGGYGISPGCRLVRWPRESASRRRCSPRSRTRRPRAV